MKIKRGLQPAPERLMLQRIEQQRVPDIFFRTMTTSGWIELKIRPTGKEVLTMPFRKGQFAWIKEYRQMGGLVFLFFYLNWNEYLYIFKNYNILPAYVMPQPVMNEHQQAHNIYDYCCYHEKITLVNWDHILNILSDKPSLP
jgi:hypothetical protein